MVNLAQGRRSLTSLLVCGVMMSGAALFESALQPVGVSHGYLATSRDKNAAVAEAAGEFRIVLANVLWDRVVDHYHHQFMAQGGDWEKNQSLLPLLQTIITLDPHFVEAYELMGGTILPRLGRVTEGQQVLAQGIKYNPYDWEIDREMAMLYAWTEHRPKAALPYAQAGLAQADDDFSRRLMTKLCRTLEQRVHKEGSADPPAPSGPAGLPPKPALAATARQSPPSASNSASANPS
jgi:hypothetical protein